MIVKLSTDAIYNNRRLKLLTPYPFPFPLFVSIKRDNLSLHHFYLLTSQNSLSQIITSGGTDMVDPESDGA